MVSLTPAKVASSDLNFEYLDWKGELKQTGWIQILASITVPLGVWSKAKTIKPQNDKIGYKTQFKIKVCCKIRS